MDKHIFIREWCDAFEISAQHVYVTERFKRALFAFLLILLHGSLEVKKSQKQMDFLPLEKENKWKERRKKR